MKFSNFIIIFHLFTASLAINETCILKSGATGQCKRIAECESLLEEFTSGDFSHMEPCSMSDEIGVFCCPIQSSMLDPKLSKSCQKIMQIKEQLNSELNHNSSMSSIDDLPFMAQIYIREFVGAGVLLSESFVLTAAHVVYVRRSMPIVHLGKNKNSLPEHVVNVKQVIIHELYIPRESYNDIALLSLKKPIILNNRVIPICLHNSQIELTDDKKLILSVWKGSTSNDLISREIEQLPQSKCANLYNRTDCKIKLPDGICSEKLFCGRIIKDCNDLSTNDGPVHVLINGTHFLYAFATSTNTNCHSELPGLYTKISDATEWIENVISNITP